MIVRPLVWVLFGGACATASLGAAAAESNPSCTRPSEVAAQPTAIQVPDYADASDAVDAQTQAAREAWLDYQTSVFESLSRSPDPRDWALATLTGVLKFDLNGEDENQRGQAAALLERATQAARDDALVQWIAVRQSNKTDARVTGNTALQTLQRLEPDNAAVWLDVMAEAVARKDETAVDAALAKMSASTRFDDHFAELMKAITEIYLRYPVPDAYQTLAPEQEKQLSREAIPFVNAMAVTAAVALPSFQHVVNACRVNQDTGKNGARAVDCAATGRMMAAHGDNLLANRIGYSLLRVSHTFTDEDALIARNDDWIYARFLSMVTDQIDGQSPEQIIAYQKNWIETGSELEAMRRQLADAGISLTPPSNWVDDQSPFSAERLQRDEDFLKKREP